MSCVKEFKYCVGAFFLLITQGCYAQNDAAGLLSTFEAYASTNLQEKVFVHTDRDFYVTGELIWFKIYSVDATDHKPLDLNKVAYVELVDRNKQPQIQLKVALDNGRGSGSLFIPSSVHSDVYTLRVYTQWMKNYSADFYFNKPITIVNPFNAPSTEQSERVRSSLDVAFFPEGGNLVAGVKNKIAFKISQGGRGVNGTGVIVNQQGDTISKFASLKFGLGSFVFAPSASDRYNAIVTNGQLQKTTAALPPARSEGFTMLLQEKAGEVKVTVSQGTHVDSDGLIYLFIHARQVTWKALAKSLRNDSAIFHFQKNELPDGISHLTVFDDKLKPQCERLYFKKPTNQLALKVSGNRTDYAQREKVVLSLQGAQNANCSIAVTRLDSLSTAASGDISTYFWLQADLVGEIESPEYYFSDDDRVSEASNNLMLTHGWRRFKWDSVLHGKNRKRYPPEFGGHRLVAKAMSRDGIPVANCETFLSIPGTKVDIFPAVSSQQGEVNFEVKNFVGSQKIVLQTNSRLDSTSHVEIVDPFSQDFNSFQLQSLLIDPYQVSSIMKRSIYMQALDIYNREKIERFVPVSVDSSSFYGSADENYWLDRYTRFPVMEEVMREYVKGVMVRKRKDGFHFIVLNTVIANNPSVFRETPLILLDGVPIFDEDEIMAFDPLKIKKLEVVTHKYFLGPKVFHGIVSFKTYRGDLDAFQLNPKSVVLNYEGLARQREFYSPNYSSGSNKRIPDFRTLLYWNPDVRLGETTATFEFHTSDVPGRYQATVQGISVDGKVGSQSFQFEVSR